MTASIPTVIETNPTEIHIWKPATWEDYLTYRDDPTTEKVRLFFHHEYLLVLDMGGEGINHAVISDLFTMLFLSGSAKNQNRYLVPWGVA